MGKPVSDVDIINLAVDEEGNPFQEGTFFGGMKREMFRSSLAGATAGAKAQNHRLCSPDNPANCCH